LRDFRRASGPAGTQLVRGLPVDEPNLPPTPVVEGSVQRTLSVPALVLLMAAAELGDPIAFDNEKSGALVQDVVPVPGREAVHGNTGSVRLSFHNENAFHRHRPDYVMLLCLRADPDGRAGLRTASVRELLPVLSTATRQALAAPEYVTAPPPSFSNRRAATPHPVLSGAPDDPDIRVDLAATNPLTPRAANALTELHEAMEDTGHTVYLSPGDLVLVDNRVAVHGRTAFRPRYDGTDRWLQRVFVATDLRRSRPYRPGDGYVLLSDEDDVRTSATTAPAARTAEAVET
jgi:L-asparagine oxygenase